MMIVEFVFCYLYLFLSGLINLLLRPSFMFAYIMSTKVEIALQCSEYYTGGTFKLYIPKLRQNFLSWFKRYIWQYLWKSSIIQQYSPSQFLFLRARSYIAKPIKTNLETLKSKNLKILEQPVLIEACSFAAERDEALHKASRKHIFPHDHHQPFTLEAAIQNFQDKGQNPQCLHRQLLSWKVMVGRATNMKYKLFSLLFSFKLV